ncbi:NAD-P-binding protein [Trametes elegans]|nr:NAD-P-binding protein [Trametes elegans]
MGALFSRGFNPDRDIPDLSRKVIIVTGGNSGIGYAIIRQLARHGAKVYMGARNEQRAKAAIERLHTEGLGPGNGEVVWLPLDLSDPRRVKQAAEEFLKTEDRLDVLVNNAAMLLVPYTKSRDGLQDIVMVNYIGACVFTRTLLPILKRTAEEPNSDVRVVFLNSARHYHCPGDVRFRNIDDLNRSFEDTSFPQLLRYSYTKIMQLHFIRELQRRLDDEGVPILLIAVDPGEVDTEGVQAYANSVGPLISPLYRLIVALAFTAPAKGALGPLFAAAAPAPRAHSNTYRGAYLKPPGVPAQAAPLADRADLRTELWDTTDAFLRSIGLDLPA